MRRTSLLVLVLLVAWPIDGFGFSAIKVPSTTGWTNATAGTTCNDPAGILHWDATKIPLRVDHTVPVSYHSRIQKAVDAWNAVIGNAYTIELSFVAPVGGYGAVDGQNAIYHGALTGLLGVTSFVVEPGGVIAESDIVILHPGQFRCPASYTAAVTHEIGHMLGLHHTAPATWTCQQELEAIFEGPDEIEIPTMSQGWTGSFAETLAQDDKDGIECVSNRFLPIDEEPNTTAHLMFVDPPATLPGTARAFELMSPGTVEFTLTFETPFSGAPSCMGLQVDLLIDGNPIPVHDDTSSCGIGGGTFSVSHSENLAAGVHSFSYEARVVHNGGPPTVPFPVALQALQVFEGGP